MNGYSEVMTLTRQQRFWMALSVILWGLSSPGWGREFDDTDIFPFFKDIVFSKTAIGFPASRHYSSRFGPFLLKRDSRSLLAVGLLAFEQAFPDWGEETDRAGEKHGFVTKEAYCGEGGVGHDDKLFKDGKLIPVPIGRCSSISAFQVIGDQLWLGIPRQGEGNVSMAEGVVVMSLDDWRHLGTVSVPGAVGTLRADPYSDDVWVATQVGFFGIDRQLKLVSEHYFYYDFDPNTARPLLLVAPELKKSNPLAVVMREVPFDEADRKAFYEAVKTIPQEDLAYYFSLYTFYMCCDPYSKFYPSELNVLVPFFIKATGLAPAYMKNAWYQAVCRFDDKRAAEFLLKEAKDYDQTSEYILLRCLEKYGLDREAHQAAIDHKERQEQRRKADAERKLAELTKSYFIEPKRGAYEDLCSLMRRNPDYIGRVVALFEERGIDASRDGNFFRHCLGRNMGEPGFEQFLPVVAEALQSTDSLGILSSACGAVRRMRQDYLPGMVIPILYARRITHQSMQKYQWAAINPNLGFYVSCANASLWVIDREERVDLLLAELRDHPEIQGSAFDTLHELTGENFRTVDEWQNWWVGHRKLKQ